VKMPVPVVQQEVGKDAVINVADNGFPITQRHGGASPDLWALRRRARVEPVDGHDASHGHNRAPAHASMRVRPLQSGKQPIAPHLPT
jgi:hypothetical protein